ncbi:MAG: HAMP domain-containing sensor histidine kinase [bacterium]
MANQEILKREQRIEELELQASKKLEFFLAASHQLKSPLAIIQWCLQTVLESKEVVGKDRELVQTSIVQAEAMTSLVTDMLHVFRLSDRQNRRQEYVAVNMNGLIDTVLKEYEMTASQKGIHLIRGPIEVLPTIYADQAYLRQAVINLITNAIKYSSDGSSVTVTSQTSADGWIEVAVEDHGIGMTEADQQRLFSEFFRSEEARQIAHEGTGLGLVLVKRIIEELGGEVKVKSELHKGSTFTLRLPVGNSPE